MNHKLFMDRVLSRMQMRGFKSERQFLMAAGVSVDVLRKFRKSANHNLNLNSAAKIAEALDVPLGWLTGEVQSLGNSSPAERARSSMVEEIEVVGEVKAGAWHEALEWDEAERFSIQVPKDLRYPGLKRWGFRIGGGSMDKLFPHGSIVQAIKLSDLNAPPPNKSAVVVHAKRPGLWEATCKVYVVKPDGSIRLEPRSSDPQYKAIILDDDGSKLPKDVESVDLFALVTGVYMQQ